VVIISLGLGMNYVQAILTPLTCRTELNTKLTKLLSTAIEVGSVTCNGIPVSPATPFSVITEVFPAGGIIVNPVIVTPVTPPGAAMTVFPGPTIEYRLISPIDVGLSNADWIRFPVTSPETWI
jgi:hypothetical protein